MRDRTDIVEMFKTAKKEEKFLKMAAPMVRYSKLSFRLLCLKWGSDVVYTPMIIAESFNRSEQSRVADFSTCEEDTPLVAQLGTNSPIEFGAAAVKLSPYVDAVDLNCGCPQRWAVQEEIGAFLSGQPEMVSDIIKQAKRMTDTPISVKIRLNEDILKTIELVKGAEAAGASWITIHGRTRQERCKVPVHRDLIKLVREHTSLPIVANGDMVTKDVVGRMVKETGVEGVMVARGILSNPAFWSRDELPFECVEDYLELCLSYGR